MKQATGDLDIGDPFIHFAKQAYRNAKRFGLPSEFINESIAIVKSAFGEEWFRTTFGKSEKELPVILLSRHPLTECFTIAGEAQIAEVMELAVYLKHLSKVKNLDYVITEMKDKFYSGLLQLAYAYRFLRLGATDLELEPQSSKGRKADIAFKLLNTRIIVECYMPRVKDQDTSQELQHSVRPIFDALKEKDAIYRIKIRLINSIGATQRKHIQRTVISMIRSVDAQEPMEREDEFAHISIEPVSETGEGEDLPRVPGPWKISGGADWVVSVRHRTMREVQGIRNGMDERREMGSRLFVWRAPEEKKPLSLHQRVEELRRKISRKVSQAKTADAGTKRIIVVSVEEGRHEDYDDVRICDELHRRVVLGHSNVFLLILTARVWTMENAHRYAGVHLCGTGANLAPSLALVKSLSVLEEQHNILEDWK